MAGHLQRSAEAARSSKCLKCYLHAHYYSAMHWMLAWKTVPAAGKYVAAAEHRPDADGYIEAQEAEDDAGL